MFRATLKCKWAREVKSRVKVDTVSKIGATFLSGLDLYL